MDERFYFMLNRQIMNVLFTYVIIIITIVIKYVINYYIII